MKFKYVLSILLILSGKQCLISSEGAPKAPELTFEQEYDRNPTSFDHYFGQCFQAKVCQHLSTEAERNNCHQASQTIMPLLLGRMTSAIPYQNFNNRAEWEAWLQTQSNTLLMLSKSRCFPCAEAHAFLGNYVEKCKKHGTSIVAMPSKNVDVLENQGVIDFTTFEGTPEFYPIENGKIRHDLKIDGLNPDALKEFLRNHCP